MQSGELFLHLPVTSLRSPQQAVCAEYTQFSVAVVRTEYLVDKGDVGCAVFNLLYLPVGIIALFPRFFLFLGVCVIDIDIQLVVHIFFVALITLKLQNA